MAAARLQMLKTKAAEASRFVARNGCAYYKETMEKNKKYVVEPPTVEKCQELSKQLFYTRLARFKLLKLSGVCKVKLSPTFATLKGISSARGKFLRVFGRKDPIGFILLPVRYEAFWNELHGVKNVWKNRHELKVEDAGIAALFGLELYAWFCVGEIMGRGFTLTGYYP